MARRKTLVVADDLLDQLPAGRDPQSVFSKDGPFDDLKGALAERALDAEMGRRMDGEAGDGRRNGRNGCGEKTLLTEAGELDVSAPRDRLSTFDPQLAAKRRRRVAGFDEKIASIYARGVTAREIRGHLDERYGLDVSPDLISAVADEVLDEVAEWRRRSLEPLCPLVFFDALRVKVRDEGAARNKAVCVAPGVRIERAEGAKFWLRVTTELKNRGVEDDRRGRRAQGISRRDRRRVSRSPGSDPPKAVLGAPDPKLARLRVRQGWQGGAAESDWGWKRPAVAPRSHGSWRRRRRAAIPFFAFPDDARRIIHAANAIEALNAKLAPRGQGQRPLPDRRERRQAALLGLEPG